MLEPETLLSLAEGPAAPRFSPGGTHLVYVESGSAWVAPVRPAGGGAAPRAVGPGRAVRWHPAGDALTALRAAPGGGPQGVWRFPLGPGPEAPLSPEGIAVRDYALSPDGRTLALLEAGVPRVLLEGRAVRVRYPPPGALWLVDLATGAAQKRCGLPPDEAPLRPSLSWSPDGRFLVWEVFRSPEDRQENPSETAPAGRRRPSGRAAPPGRAGRRLRDEAPGAAGVGGHQLGRAVAPGRGGPGPGRQPDPLRGGQPLPPGGVAPGRRGGALPRSGHGPGLRRRLGAGRAHPLRRPARRGRHRAPVRRRAPPRAPGARSRCPPRPGPWRTP